MRGGRRSHCGGDWGIDGGTGRGGGFVGQALGTLNDVHASQQVALDELCGVAGVGVVDLAFYVVDTRVGNVSECI